MESKEDLQELGVTDRSSIILSTKKVIYKHNYVHTVNSKEDLLLKKVGNFKTNFNEMFKKGFPFFWDDKGNLISKEIYHSLLVQQRNEDFKLHVP